jgi:tRNA pseudouridine38-40 synthase
VRTLRRLDVSGAAGDAIDLWYEGSGFLRHMVRNLSGTLIEVGSGRRDPEGMTVLLAARDRRRAGPTAPPHALTLVSVSYESTKLASC